MGRLARARAYALTPKAITYLDRFGGLDTMPPDPPVPRRERVHTAPGMPLRRGICPDCGNSAKVLLDGRMGLHPAERGGKWCDGVGHEPEWMVLS